jgi:titin
LTDCHFVDRPSPPGKPHLSSDSELTPDLVTILWAKPIRDGGSPITGYLVEHRRTGSPHWVRATPLMVPFPELTLSGLEPGWRYQFRVRAENAVGLSDPSDASEPLTVTLQKYAITAPKFTEELKDVTVLENDKVEFLVHFLGQPPPRCAGSRTASRSSAAGGRGS